jgi:hypothetical protein
LFCRAISVNEFTRSIFGHVIGHSGCFFQVRISIRLTLFARSEDGCFFCFTGSSAFTDGSSGFAHDFSFSFDKISRMLIFLDGCTMGFGLSSLIDTFAFSHFQYS